jgi:hypothetical protein
LLKLETIAACNDVLLDEQNNPTLVSIFCALDTAHAQGATIDAGAIAPREWKIVTLWLADETDLGKTFTQKTVVMAPNGKEFGNASSDFTAAARSHNIRQNVSGLPVGVEGSIVISVWLESGKKKISDVYKYEISIRHRKQSGIPPPPGL